MIIIAMLLDFTHVAQEDYNSTRLNTTFSPDESELTIRIPILNDPSREESEIFYGYLLLISGFFLEVIEVAIEISYSDCK